MKHPFQVCIICAGVSVIGWNAASLGAALIYGAVWTAAVLALPVVIRAYRRED